MKRPFLVFILALSLLSGAHAGNGKLVLKVYYQPASRDETSMEGVITLPIVVILTNHGLQNVTVPSGNLAVSEQNAKDEMTVWMEFNASELKDGTVAVIAPTLIAPVELRPGESTLIRVRLKHLLMKNLSRIHLFYQVTPQLAERYGLWSGQLETWAEEGTPFTSR